MPNISAMVVNVRVDDMDTALPLYQELAGGVPVTRFPFGEVQLALVGPYLLIAGADEERQSHLATVLVQSLDPVIAALAAAGAEITEGPGQVPNGTRLVARHPDGAMFEYLRPVS